MGAMEPADFVAIRRITFTEVMLPESGTLKSKKPACARLQGWRGRTRGGAAMGGETELALYGARSIVAIGGELHYWK